MTYPAGVPISTMSLNRLTAWKLYGLNFTLLNIHRVHWYAYNSVFYVSQSFSHSKYEENCHLECDTMKSERSLLNISAEHTTSLFKFREKTKQTSKQASKQLHVCLYYGSVTDCDQHQVHSLIYTQFWNIISVGMYRKISVLLFMAAARAPWHTALKIFFILQNYKYMRKYFLFPFFTLFLSLPPSLLSHTFPTPFICNLTVILVYLTNNVQGLPHFTCSCQMTIH